MKANDLETSFEIGAIIYSFRVHVMGGILVLLYLLGEMSFPIGFLKLDPDCRVPHGFVASGLGTGILEQLFLHGPAKVS